LRGHPAYPIDFYYEIQNKGLIWIKGLNGGKGLIRVKGLKQSFMSTIFTNNLLITNDKMQSNYFTYF